MIVVSNTSPLIHLEKIGRLELLRELFGEIRIPRAVEAELLQRRPPRELPGWVRPSVAAVPDVVARLAARVRGRGEAETLALAVRERADLVLTDDRMALREAKRLGLEVTGTLGVLVRAKRQGLLEEIRGEVERLRQAGAWFGRDVVVRALVQAGERPAPEIER